MIQKRGMAGIDRLSPRERQIRERLESGQSLKQVALSLGISHKTVECHSQHIREKLNLPPD